MKRLFYKYFVFFLTKLIFRLFSYDAPQYSRCKCTAYYSKKMRVKHYSIVYNQRYSDKYDQIQRTYKHCVNKCSAVCRFWYRNRSEYHADNNRGIRSGCDNSFVYACKIRKQCQYQNYNKSNKNCKYRPLYHTLKINTHKKTSLYIYYKYIREV